MLYRLQLALYLFWFPLMCLTINALLRAGVRRYPLIFTYLVIALLIGVTQAPASLEYHRFGRKGASLQNVQAVGEVVAYAILLMVVFSLIYQATSRFGARRLTRSVLMAVPLVVIAASYVINHDGKTPLGVWIANWMRDLKFCAAVLDLALWSLLLITRNRDVKLLLLTGGMGVMFAGNAIGESMRQMALARGSNGVYLAAYATLGIADLAMLFIWWRAFREGGKHGRRAQAV